jgi:tetratricopeptide (TPR) repeat protein
MTYSATPIQVLTYFVVGRDKSTAVADEIVRNTDMTAGDSDHLIHWYDNAPDGDWLKDVISVIQKVNPDSPWLVVRSIRDHWDEEKAKKYETDFSDYPTVLFELGKKYSELKKWPDAERVLKAYDAVSPDYVGYEALAQVYLAQKQDDHWLATLQEYLQQPDFGLQHSLIQEEIADHYMDEGKFAEALPFAQDASATASAAGIECEAAVQAGLGDWTKAENLIRDEISHYSFSPYHWYAWCIRTGHGDRAAASAALREFISGLGSRASDESRLEEAILGIVEDKPDDAIDALRRRFTNIPGPNSPLYTAILCDAKDDADARAAALEQSIQWKKDNPPVGGLAELLRDTLKAGPQSIPDPAAVDRLVKDAESKSDLHTVVTVYYCLSRYLDHHGHSDLATDYLHRCVGKTDKADRDFWATLLVDDALRRRGEDPLELERAARPTHQISLSP